MNMKKTYTLPISAAAIALALVTAFQNCSSSSLPTELTDGQSLSVEPVDELKLVIPNPSVAVSTQQTLSASGGTPPYVFSVSSGVGTIDPGTGLHSAGATAGTSMVNVRDSKGVFANGSIAVAIVEAPVVPGNLDVGNAGSQTFTVPKFNKITIEVYSGGGGGAGLTYIDAGNGTGGPGAVGGTSSVKGGALDIVALGGKGGQPGHVRYANGAGGAGGTASGGEINRAGTAGALRSGGAAGGPNGGAGGGVVLDYPHYRGQPGVAPGGGGGGLSFDDAASATDRADSGGGGGGSYTKTVLTTQADLPVGTTLRLVVGGGGAGGKFSNGVQQGASGAAGKIRIVWE